MEKKLIFHLNEYLKYSKEDQIRKRVFKDGNFSVIISGLTGCGKDSLCLSLVDTDMEQKRTIIVFDTKMEYPNCIFMQNDEFMKNILIKKGILPKSYKVNLYLPFIVGMEKNKSFKKLFKLKHPNLKVKAFRILTDTLDSDDTRSFALSMTQTQAMGIDEKMKEKLKGMAKDMLEYREEFGKKYMVFDSIDRREENCNWEYINFDGIKKYKVIEDGKEIEKRKGIGITNNKEINVFSFYFMLRRNTITTISTMIGLLNELLSRAMKHRKKSDVFAIYIPEIQILLPKGVKQLEIVAKSLRYRLLIGLLLMRSFNARMRINLQNLSSLEADLFSQSKIYMGRTQNPKDLRLLKQNYHFPKSWINKIWHLPIGVFIDIQKDGNEKMFNIIPKSHKAKEREPFLMKLEKFNKKPDYFLFETKNVNLTDLDIIDLKEFKDGINYKLYNNLINDWIKKQKILYPKQLDISVATELDRRMDLKEKEEIPFYNENN